MRTIPLNVLAPLLLSAAAARAARPRQRNVPEEVAEMLDGILGTERVDRGEADKVITYLEDVLGTEAVPMDEAGTLLHEVLEKAADEHMQHIRHVHWDTEDRAAEDEVRGASVAPPDHGPGLVSPIGRLTFPHLNKPERHGGYVDIPEELLHGAPLDSADEALMVLHATAEEEGTEIEEDTVDVGEPPSTESEEAIIKELLLRNVVMHTIHNLQVLEAIIDDVETVRHIEALLPKLMAHVR